MSQYGSTFATAEVIDQTVNNFEVEANSTSDISYFKFSVDTAINETRFSHIFTEFPNYNGSSNVNETLYDSTETQISTRSYPLNTGAVTFTDLAIGDYFIKVELINHLDTVIDYKLHVINEGYFDVTEDLITIPTIFQTVEIDYHTTPLFKDIEAIFTSTTLFPNWENDATDIDNLQILNIEPHYKIGGNKLHVFGLERSTRMFYSKDGQDANIIEGIVYLDEDPLANKIVRLYNKQSGQMIDETISNDQGEYKFNAYLFDDKYYVVAFDELSNPVYQALALDDLSPKTVTL